MDTLLQHCKVEYQELDHIVFCGGFGSYIDPHSAELIGLIPPGFAGKTIAIGNAAGTGASRILQSKQLEREAMGSPRRPTPSNSRRTAVQAPTMLKPCASRSRAQE